MDNKTNSLELLIPISLEEKQELSNIKERFISLTIKIMDKKSGLPIDLLKVYPETPNLEKIYDQLSDLKKCLDSFRPFNIAQMAKLQEAFDVEYTYESNRIEGNTLTLMETDLVINKGMTIEGKPLKDHFEAVNHKNAIDFVRNLVDKKTTFSHKILMDIHALILNSIDPSNAGCYRRDNVRISGSRHLCPNFLKVPDLMDKYFAWYQENKEILHPVQLAAEIHEKLVTIHPFIDGNGRTARLVMNLILLQNGYPIAVIASDREKRNQYYQSLEACHVSATEDNSQFKLLVAKYVKTWVFKYLEFIAPSGNTESKNKGYYFFKKIEPYINQEKD